MLTQKRLKQVLYYSPATGVFTRLIRTTNRVKVGDIAGSPSNDGYIQIMVDGRLFKASRLAFLYMTGKWPRHLAEHKDLDPANNKWVNLRSANYSQNKCNTRKRIDNTSGYKGVCWFKPQKKWAAKITLSGVTKFLGYFDTALAGHRAYRKAAKCYHGKFARAA